MAYDQVPITFPPVYSTNFITYLLHRHIAPTTLIICSSRETFLADLQTAIQHTHPQEPSAPPEALHPLLIPTLQLLAISRTVHLAFTPTLPHLRAYLSTYVPPDGATTGALSYKMPRRNPTLALLNSISLHRSTTEHSAQGLSHTLAIGVEAANRAEMQLIIAESRKIDDSDSSVDVDLGGSRPWIDYWREQVPLLSCSIGFGVDKRVSTGRTVEIGSVLRRWCRFAQLEEGNGVEEVEKSWSVTFID